MRLGRHEAHALAGIGQTHFAKETVMDSYQVVSVSAAPNPARAHLWEVHPEIWVTSQDVNETQAVPRGCQKQSWSEWISFRRTNFPWN